MSWQGNVLIARIILEPINLILFNLIRYINDCINPAGYNAVFQKQPELGMAYVVALRDIEVGEEIFVDYGKWYWAKLKPTRLPLSKIFELRRFTTSCSVPSDKI